jgi:hypothetical protein
MSDPSTSTPSELVDNDDQPQAIVDTSGAGTAGGGGVDEEAEIAKSILLKDEGNVDFRQGVLFAKHTMGKNHLCSACAKYAEVSAIDLQGTN